MRKLLTVLAVLVLVGCASAIVLEISFGQGIRHNTSNITMATGSPKVGTRYYFTDGGNPEDVGDAFVVSDINKSGVIIYQEQEKVGDCTWEAHINGTTIEASVFNGTIVAENDEIKWSVKPNNTGVVHCKLVMDYNVA